MANEKILVVDDSPEIVRFLRHHVLTPWGYSVITASDGQAGLATALVEKPDLIMVDMNMPKMTGLQMIQALRREEFQAPVIFMTVHGSESIAVEVFRLGVRDYLAKPFTVDDVRTAVDNSLKQERLEREKETLTKNLIASETVRQTVVTLSHYINNNLMILNGGVGLLTEALQKTEFDRSMMLKVLKDLATSVNQIAAVMRILRQATNVKLTTYYGAASMIDIDTALRREMNQTDEEPENLQGKIS
jgi:DNA-binding response OmpR family regulator